MKEEKIKRIIKKNEKMIIYDSMNENLMSMITPLKATKECFDTLTNIYEKKAPTQKRDLMNTFRKINMEKDDTYHHSSQIFHK